MKDDNEIKNAAIEAGLRLASGIEYLVMSRDLNDKQKVKALEAILDLGYVMDINAGVEILIKERRLYYDE